MAHLIWYFTGAAKSFGLLPLLRAAFVCGALYQIDLLLVLAMWLCKKVGVLSSESTLEPENRHTALLVLPTLLRKDSELEGLRAAMRSAAHNGYTGHLVVVACIDDRGDRPDLFWEIRAWAAAEAVPPNVELHVIGSPGRVGKACAIDRGVRYTEQLVEEGRLARFPTLFFNMDADSTLGPRALERMAYKLTRKRRLWRTPHFIVTSNVLVAPEECVTGLRSMFRVENWIATLVAREYLTSISLGRCNTKIFPVNEASGALFCTWSDVYRAGPRYARFMQSLRLVDWLAWWLGSPPPCFSEYTGDPLPEAMTGPGDDTWITWLASSAVWREGRPCFDFPRTPLHALGRLALTYLSRPVSYDPLAKVYTKTPTTTRALFAQRLRWNSSRVQDIQRWASSHVYHWQNGFPVVATSALVALYSALSVASVVAPFVVARHASEALPVSLLAGAGYMTVRLTGTVVALIVSECSWRHWLALVSLPFSGLYHVVFNMATTTLGSVRDIYGFGERTTFSPECTLRKSGLTRIALAYRLRRAVLLACRAAVFGDVPWGAFWFGWRETPWTPNGFDGWGSGVRPSPVYWPKRRRGTSNGPPALGGAIADG